MFYLAIYRGPISIWMFHKNLKSYTCTFYDLILTTMNIKKKKRKKGHPVVGHPVFKWLECQMLLGPLCVFTWIKCNLSQWFHVNCPILLETPRLTAHQVSLRWHYTRDVFSLSSQNWRSWVSRSKHLSVRPEITEVNHLACQGVPLF